MRLPQTTPIIASLGGLAMIAFCRSELMNAKQRNRKWNWIAGSAVLLCCMTVGLAYAQDVTVTDKGLITSRSGETMTVQTQDAGNVAVVLTPETKVDEKEGKLHMRHKELA